MQYLPNIFQQELGVLSSAKLHMSGFKKEKHIVYENVKQQKNWFLRYSTYYILPVTQAGTNFCPLFPITEVIS